MSSVTCQISISLDGYVAGPEQSAEDPLGKGGMRLHEWVVATRSWREQHGMSGGERGVDDDIARTMFDGVGAYVMGRNMFGPGRGAWDLEWRGWWGDEPPYHAPVFVLTHHEREPLRMRGGTTFTFVTGGVDDALAQARAAAGDGDVHVSGGAQTIQQHLAAGLLDELTLHVAPVILGAGERLFDGVGDPELKPVEAIHSPAATHVRYRVGD